MKKRNGSCETFNKLSFVSLMLMLLHYFAFAQSVEHMCVCRSRVLNALIYLLRSAIADS